MGKKKIYELKLYDDGHGNVIHKSKFINKNNTCYDNIAEILIFREFSVGCARLLEKLYGIKFFCQKISKSAGRDVIDVIDLNLDLGAIYNEIMNGEIDDVKTCLFAQQSETKDSNLKNLKFDHADLATFEKEFLEVARKRFDPCFES
jgi:hypothetical protein